MHLLQGSWMIGADDIPGFRRLADLLEVNLGEQITRPELQKMFEVCGADTVFANNIATVKRNLKAGHEIPHPDFMSLFNVSGLLREQPLRTVRGVCGRASVKPSVTVIICGATATQMYLRIKEALRQARLGTIRIERLVGLASNERLCDTLDELEDLRLLALKSRTGRLPTEARMLHYLFDDLPVTLRHEVVPLPELQLEPQLKAFAREISPTDIYVPTTGNTQYVALTARRVLRKTWGGGFDRSDRVPALFTSNCARPLAVVPWQCATPLGYVHPLTVPSGLVRFAWELFLVRAS